MSDQGKSWGKEWGGTQVYGPVSVGQNGDEQIISEWYRIEAPKFTADIRIGNNGRADHGAPILRWLMGKHIRNIRRICQTYGWKLEDLQNVSE